MRGLTVAGTALLLASAILIDLTASLRWLSTALLLLGLILALLGPTWLSPAKPRPQPRAPYGYRVGLGAALLLVAAVLLAAGYRVTATVTAGLGVACLAYQAPCLHRRTGGTPSNDR